MQRISWIGEEVASDPQRLTVRGFCRSRHGSACGPVIVPVFKTGGWQAILSPVGSTPTRFRHLSMIQR